MRWSVDAIEEGGKNCVHRLYILCLCACACAGKHKYSRMVYNVHVNAMGRLLNKSSCDISAQTPSHHYSVRLSENVLLVEMSNESERE